jgi:uncharacterized membrane protein
MKPNSTFSEIVLILLLITPFIYLGIIWNQLPAEIAIHYDLLGKPDDWARKETAALLMGSMSVLLYLLLRFLPAIDPKKQLQSSNFQKIRLVITLTMAVITGWLWYMAGHQTHQKMLVSLLLALISLMLAGIGNYLTTIKPNWFVGIRTPWTLGNEVVWRKTHQMGGRLMVAGGLLSAVMAIVVPMPYTAGVVVGIMMITLLIPVVYSYIYFRQEKTRQLN